MLELLPFVPEDAPLFVPQLPQAAMPSDVDWGGAAVRAAAHGPTWTAWRDGDVVGLGGFVVPWPGRAQAWAMVGAGIPTRAWPAIHRAVRASLASMQRAGFRRIEAEAASGFAAGDRWLRMLGFDRIGTARKFGPAGEDFHLYELVF